MPEPRVHSEPVEKTEMSCKVCGKKPSSNDYCRLHEKAHRNLVEKYERWNKALGISWTDYLIEVARNPLTGARAKEVAEALSSGKP
jgi:hypothetical protein